jgi:multiple sugar transport system substrate-binding protein
MKVPAIPVSRNITRRSLLLGAAAATIMPALARRAVAAPTLPGNPAEGELNVWGGVPPETGPSALFAAFMEKYPGIKVNYTRYVADTQGNLKVDTALQGGGSIDIVQSYVAPIIAKRATSGVLLDLTDQITGEDPFASMGFKSRCYQFDGRIYALPITISPVSVYVNEQMLDKAGVKIPENWTTDDFADVVRELAGAGRWGTYNSPQIARKSLGVNYRYTSDGKASNFRNPRFAEEIQFDVDLIKAGVEIPETEIIAKKLDTYIQGPFLKGDVAMMINRPFMLRYIKNTTDYPHDFRTALYPEPLPKGVSASEVWNTGAYDDHTSITKSCTNPAAAWTLIKWWAEAGGTYMAPSGRIPIIKGNDSVETLSNLLMGPDAEKLFNVESLRAQFYSDKHLIPVDTILTAAPRIDEIVARTTQRARLGEITVPEWVDIVTRESDAAIARA